MSDDFQRTLNKALENPEFRQLWEADEPEYQAISEKISLHNAGLPPQKE